MRMKHSERGNAVIELALVTPVIFLVLFGAMDFARVFAAVEILTGAARSAAQNAIYQPGAAGDESGNIAAGRSDTQGMSGITITSNCMMTCTSGGVLSPCSTTPPCVGSNPILYVRTTATANFSTLITYPGISNPISLTGRAEIRTQ